MDLEMLWTHWTRGDTCDGRCYPWRDQQWVGKCSSVGGTMLMSLADLLC